MRAIGGGEDEGTRGIARIGQAMMQIVRRVQAETAVSMFDVVPRKEVGQMRPCVFERAEAFRKVRPIFERFELRFRIRIIVRDVRSRMRFCDAKSR